MVLDHVKDLNVDAQTCCQRHGLGERVVGDRGQHPAEATAEDRREWANRRSVIPQVDSAEVRHGCGARMGRRAVVHGYAPRR